MANGQRDASTNVRRAAMDRFDRDAEWAARAGGVREDIQRARQIIAQGGLTTLRDALKSGVALPAFALPFLVAQARPGSQDE
jgi:hypothetical protein